MSTFSKMVIMTSDEADRLRDKKITQYNPTIRSMANLDSEMESILNQKNMEIEEKLTRYQTALMRFGQLSESRVNHPAIAPLPAIVPAVGVAGVALPPAAPGAPVPAILPATPFGAVGTTDPTTNFLTKIRVDEHDNAEQVLTHLKNFPDIINHDENGQIVLDGRVIPGSNYSDILTSLFRTNLRSLNVEGRTQFLSQLKSVGLDPNLVKNKLAQNIISGRAPRVAAGITPHKGEGRPTFKKRAMVKGTKNGPPGVRPKVFRLYY